MPTLEIKEKKSQHIDLKEIKKYRLHHYRLKPSFTERGIIKLMGRYCTILSSLEIDASIKEEPFWAILLYALSAPCYSEN
ncbi:MAG TPA: hypothetical protein VJY31_07140 [Buttiauxella sp.]|nr:hypothetical protein [Buttiauxella sp.]